MSGTKVSSEPCTCTSSVVSEAFCTTQQYYLCKYYYYSAVVVLEGKKAFGVTDTHREKKKKGEREREKAGGVPIIRRHQFFVRWSERIQTFRQKGEERCHQLQSSMAMSSPPSSDIWAWSRPLSSAVRLTLQEDCMSSSRSSRRRCMHTRLLLPPLTFGVVLRILCSS